MRGVLLEVEHRLGSSWRCGKENAKNYAMEVHNWCEHLALKAMPKTSWAMYKGVNLCKRHIMFHTLTQLQPCVNPLMEGACWRYRKLHPSQSTFDHLYDTPSLP